MILSYDKFLISMMVVYYLYIVMLIGLNAYTASRAIKSKDVDFKFFRSYLGDCPQRLAITRNHLNNQFQIPLLFFVAGILSIQTDSVDGFTLALAALFLLSRFYHSYIHLGSNDIPKRALAYMIGVITVALMLFKCLF